ncbi:phosphomannose isomerase type II C-terminal cupin domain [Agarilytica rhodophyticola]|uniref:phosphomannose isomerase type II C-terminal cupin domain n=1 Tax=Agarilytica rhodophyticola TaxID=1737490 RepID=UPI0013156215|nr:phosphomannose isomerase type II C-terminal cupin domain [Agarilytica rhodophyticola]
MKESDIKYNIGDSNTRPWGAWQVVDVGEKHIVKKITVTPDQILSLQSHEHRAEHWIIVSGQAEVTLDDKKMQLGANESVFIPQRAKHRIANIGSEDMNFIEVQIGDILDEDDITRYDDRYGRTS